MGLARHGLKHVAVLLNLIAFVLLGFYLLPSGRLKARLGHPMVLSVKVWAFAHLLANGTLADLILFGSFLVWAIVDFASLTSPASGRPEPCRSPDRRGTTRIAVVVGVLLWGLMVWRVPSLADRRQPARLKQREKPHVRPVPRKAASPPSTSPAARAARRSSR